MAVPKPGTLTPIREFTEQEEQKFKDYTKLVIRYRSRFELFEILRRNYEEWWNFTQSLLRPIEGLSKDGNSHAQRWQRHWSFFRRHAD